MSPDIYISYPDIVKMKNFEIPDKHKDIDAVATKKPLWYSENMKVTNMSRNEELLTTILFPYFSDIFTKKVDDNSRESVKWDAQEMCEEWIKHTYCEGWIL